MRSKDIEQAASFLGNQIRVGIPVTQVALRMEQLQPRHKTMWSDCRLRLEKGGYLSDGLKGHFPATVVKAISAGEQSGRLPEVLERVEKTMQLQQQIQGTVMKLMYPVGLCTAGLVVFLFFMIKVMPTLQKSLGSIVRSKEKSLIFKASDWMVHQYESNGLLILGCIGAVVALFWWISSQEDARRATVGAMLGVPVLGKAITYLYFGLWAHYVALLDSSGSFSARDKFLVPVSVLPGSLPTGVEKFADEIERRGLAKAADPDMQPEGDPRKQWPFYICSAIMVAHETGQLDRELERVAPALLKEGFGLIEKSVQVANLLAMAIAGGLIISPLAAYYVQMGKMFQQAMQS